MKNVIGNLFSIVSIGPKDDKLKNLRELRSIKHANGVRVYSDLLADVLAAKTEIFNSAIGDGSDRYRSRALSVSKTIYP